MPVWKRFAWVAFWLGWLPGARAEADSISSSSGPWSWWFAGEAGASGQGAPASPPFVGTAQTASALATTPTPASSSAARASPVPAPSPTPAVNGFINFGTAPYPDASSIANGNPQPWYDSTQVASLFGGQPNTQQQADFVNTVLQRVEQTFQLSGISVTLTTGANVPAAHTLSVVSNASSIPFPNSIGTTVVGGSGFSFIDQEAKSVQTLDNLEWIVAHNVAHELMLAFGVPEKYDQTGNYIDSTNANWSMITSPKATFSPAAAQAINAALQAQGATSGASQLAQILEPRPVPEPSAFLLWGLGALGLALPVCRRSRSRPARLASGWTPPGRSSLARRSGSRATSIG